ncbi:glycosyltransferase [bacterium 1XD8-76]|nr:glycosyltransferase [bacterium 1XD8-76]
MIKNKTIGVVVPAYNEGRLIEKVLDTMPDFVDTIIVVNDGSVDGTKEKILEKLQGDARIILYDHLKNKGLGQSLIDGYEKAIELKLDVTAVMAGDAQMDPSDLHDVVIPVVQGETDYVKGSRLLVQGVQEKMPRYRFIGNNILTLLTKFATGYWHVVDPQCGYTAISYQAISNIPIKTMIKGYGYNAHILYMLNMQNFRVKDVKVKPVYGEEVSKIKLGKYIRNVSVLLLKLFFSRIFKKNMLIDFNPLALFYLLSFICLPLALGFLIRMLVIYFSTFLMPSTTLILFVFTALMGVQSLFFAMWMDMEDNRRLRS